MRPEAPGLSVVTGAFGYTGYYIARRLLDEGHDVRTITGRPEKPNPFGERVGVAPFDFGNPERLAEHLRGAETLYNTYWVRFNRGGVTHDGAASNTVTLLRAAEAAGVSRIVHVSITNASPDSPYSYFRGKAMVEQAIIESGLSHAIIRPALIFGREDILINNIAWLLRRFPVFAVPGRGDSLVQPVWVEDLARLAVDAGRRREDLIFDAVGPEVYTFDRLLRLIASYVESRSRLFHLSPGLAWLAAKLLGVMVGDTLLTRDEVYGLTSNLLVSSGPATAPTRLTDWLSENAGCLGREYASEVSRHYR